MTYTIPYEELIESTQENYNLIDQFPYSAKVGYVSAMPNDKYSFMETFTFPDLNQIEHSLTASGKYSKKLVREIISGLKTLPEYD